MEQEPSRSALEIYPEGRLLWHRRGDDSRVWYSAPDLEDPDEWEALGLGTALVWHQPGVLEAGVDLGALCDRWLAALPAPAREAEWLCVRRRPRLVAVGGDPTPSAWIYLRDPDTLPAPAAWAPDTLGWTEDGP